MSDEKRSYFDPRIVTCSGEAQIVTPKELRMLQQRKITSNMCRCGQYHTTTPITALREVVREMRG